MDRKFWIDKMGWLTVKVGKRESIQVPCRHIEAQYIYDVLCGLTCPFFRVEKIFSETTKRVEDFVFFQCMPPVLERGTTQWVYPSVGLSEEVPDED